MSPGPNQLLGEWVLAQRTKLGWSRRELARQSGLSEGKVWRIENKNVASQDELDALQSVLPTDDSVVPLSPVRATRTQPVAPPSTVSSIEPGNQLDVLQGVLGPIPTDVEYETLDCGHTTREHAADALCPRHPRNEGVRLIANSELATFKRCRRKWWLGWYRGLKPRVDSPIGALAIGQRVHRALREWYVPEGQRRVDPSDALELFITYDWTAVTQRYAENGLEVPIELRRKFAAEADLERAMIEGYMEWLTETGADSELEVIAPETYLEADVTSALIPFETPTKLIGKLDVRIRRRRDGVNMFIDHKTVADMRRAVTTLPRDEQMQYYMLLEYLHAEASRSTESSQSLVSETDISRVQPSETVALPLLRTDDNDRSRQPWVGSSSSGREPREQLGGESQSGAPGVPLVASQQGREAGAVYAGTSSKDQRGGETSNTAQVDGGVTRQVECDTAGTLPRFAGVITALYNMLRKVKRTATAQPPFYQRVYVHHNWQTLQSFYERTLATIEDMRLAENGLNRGEPHQRWAYPNATKDCAWDCPFADVCTMFDDGSRVEAALEQYYRPGDTLSYYTEDTSLRALTHAAESTRREGTA